jgi:hypothetical protein
VNKKGKNNKKKERKTEQKIKFRCYECGKIGHKAAECKSKSQSSNEKSSMKAEIAISVNSEQKGWCLDSGATSHMCSQKDRFEKVSTAECSNLKLANSDSTEIEGCGLVPFNPTKRFSVNLVNTLFVPDLRENLLSDSKICDHGYNVLFKKDGAEIVRASNGQVVFRAKRKLDLYNTEEISESCQVSSHRQNDIKEWHERFGHLDEKDLKAAIQQGMVQGVRVNLSGSLPQCEVCIKGKQPQMPFPTSYSRSREVLELVHSDVCGPMRVHSHGGSRYFVTFIDDHSKWCELYTIKAKSEVFEKFKEFQNFAERKTGKKCKTLRSDNGTEYTNNEFKKHLAGAGIQHEFTVEYTPQQNGVAERKNRTLVEMARCMMIQAALPPSYWAEAVNTAKYIRNRCPSSSLCGETPFKLWYRRIPVVKHLRTFGQIVHSLNKTAKRQVHCKIKEMHIYRILHLCKGIQAV